MALYSLGSIKTVLNKTVNVGSVASGVVTGLALVIFVRARRSVI